MAADSAERGTASSDLFVTLVHGTWGRGFFPPLREKGRWFAEDSDFRKNLADTLTKHGFSFRVCPFLWSGANSIRKRDKAARKLTDHLRAGQLEHPNSTQVVIGHSHGGNVALRALEHLGPARNEVFLVTLATPFAEIIFSKPSNHDTRLVMTVAQFSYTLLLCLALLVLGFFFLPKTPIVDYFPKLSTPMLIAAVVGWILLLALFLLGFGRVGSWAAGAIGNRADKSQELAKLTSLSHIVRTHPILVLRAVDDEASLTLAAGAIGNRLSRFAAVWTHRLFLVSMIALAYVVTIGDTIPRYLLQMDVFSPALAKATAIFTAAAFVLFVFIQLVLIFLPGVFKSVYGRELLCRPHGCEINSHSAPDTVVWKSDTQSSSVFKPTTWGTVVTMFQAAGLSRGLRHGLYNDPQCAERIAAWLQMEFASRGK